MQREQPLLPVALNFLTVHRVPVLPPNWIGSGTQSCWCKERSLRTTNRSRECIELTCIYPCWYNMFGICEPTGHVGAEVGTKKNPKIQALRIFSELNHLLVASGSPSANLSFSCLIWYKKQNCLLHRITVGIKWNVCLNGDILFGNPLRYVRSKQLLIQESMKANIFILNQMAYLYFYVAYSTSNMFCFVYISLWDKRKSIPDFPLPGSTNTFLAC